MSVGLAQIVSVSLIAGGSLFATAQTDTSGFSESKLTSLKALKGNANSCVNFEAHFSHPLKEKPTALLDIEKSNLIEGVISLILRVTSLGPKSYRFSLDSENLGNCGLLKTSGNQISITVQNAKGADGLPILPDQREFQPFKLLYKK